MTTLQSGSSGSDVTQLQNALNALGYNLTVDGQFGTATKAAVMHFQSTWGLTLDGIVGPETFNAIKTAVAGGTPTPGFAQTQQVSVTAYKPSPAQAIKPGVTPTGGITATISGYQNYILYGAIGFVGILVLMKIMRKK